jgi:transposase
MPMPGNESLYGLARTKPGPITEVACWAHCRRQIFEVWEDKKSPVAKEAIDRIAAVYAIEAKASSPRWTSGFGTAPRRHR